MLYSSKAYEAEVVGSFSSTLIGDNGHRPVALKPERIFDELSVDCLTRMYIDVYSLRRMRPRSSREAVSVLVASARFSGENTLTSSG